MYQAEKFTLGEDRTMLRRFLIPALLLVVALLIHLRSASEPGVSRRAVAPPSASPEFEHAGIAVPKTPPPGQPLQASRSNLMELADLGDRSAADRLLSESGRCLKANRMKEVFKDKNYAMWLDENKQLLESMDPPTRARTMTSAKANIELPETSRSLCEGAEAGLSDGQIYAIALDAARLGNNDATACILAGFYDPPKLNPEQLRAFDTEAMELGRRALEQGSWNNVLALLSVYSYSGAEGQTGLISHINRADQLRVLSLLFRGTPTNSAERLPLAEQVRTLERTLTPSESFAAERWADDVYARAFVASGPAPSENSSGCDL
jgi:hypothetical protein